MSGHRNLYKGGGATYIIMREMVERKGGPHIDARSEAAAPGATKVLFTTLAKRGKARLLPRRKKGEKWNSRVVETRERKEKKRNERTLKQESTMERGTERARTKRKKNWGCCRAYPARSS